MNFGFIINALGKIAVIIGLFMATSFAWVVYYGEYHVVKPLLISSLFPIVLGIVMVLFTRHRKKNVNMPDRYLIVSVAWLYIGVIGALPFFISGYIPNFVDAFFESVSGFTTTGCTILTDIEALPYSLLFWRSLTHWIGGMGIIVLVIAVFPMFKVSGYQIFSLEASGLLNQKLKPRTTDIAKLLWIIYISITAILVVLLLIGGMNLFESLCHAFGTLGTGGFSTKNTSITNYSSFIQYTIAIFMVLSGANFTLYYSLFKGDFKRIFNNSELKFYLLIIGFITLTITLVLFFKNNLGLENSFRHSFFQVASIITTTGYATADYLQWPTQAWILLFLLLFVGGCVGSTSGGIKVIRHLVVLKYLRKHVSNLIHPNALVSVKINKKTVHDHQAQAVIMFIMLYLTIFAAGYVIMSILGLDMQTSLGSVAACLGCVGPGIGTVGPAANFFHIPEFGKITLSILMIVGRLELFTFMIILMPSFWRSN